MSAFSVNQVRQLYVVNANKASFDALANPGDVFVGHSKDSIYLQYVGALGDIMRSDLVKVKHLKYAKATSSEELAYKIKGYEVTLDPNVNGGEPVAGQDYLLRLAFREFIGVSPADQYFMYGMFHAVTGATADQLYKGIALSLYKNMTKEVNPLAEIYLVIGGAELKVGTDVTEANASTRGEATAIRLYEAAQPWHLGVMPQGVIPFNVQPTVALVDGDYRIWGKVEKIDSTKVLPEGQKIADLEWFAMGERGDQYRLMNWPNVIPTKYMVDSTKDYDMITLHYFFHGHNEAVQKSERDIQIACPNDGSHTVANAVIAALNAAITATSPEEPVEIATLA